MNRDDFGLGDLVEISDDFVPAFPASLHMGCLGVVVGHGSVPMGVQVLVEGSVHQFLVFELRLITKKCVPLIISILY